MTKKRKLYRSQKAKILGGVCGGLAEYLEIDANIMRLIFLAIGLFTVLLPMIIFYIIAWIIVPVEEESSPEKKPATTRKPQKK